MDYSFHPAAEAEFNDSIDYYESIQPGLGIELADEVLRAITRALKYPKAWSFIRNPVRRSLVNRFPYGVLYVERGGGIFILAVMNLHREPDYWFRRQ
ncbi:type II toxin-antitoxin system RelE/ParE family toxin [Marinobacter sp. G11]|uniref:type II toxin-antitoxin system RelE/ParE family toxin n=1 Tax=Marinobacter sp. G11 TaxID=2903522 RepID=UPI001E3C4395|nr:type II toxin-antitoxin system RelE/ParE family toxin [Marinobacter sp. G11]MCE0759249.1 type II toxin-antitoxin system RelE/ParE family toxin [Marinobacter sp. G11]